MTFPRRADHDDLPCVIHLVNSLEGGGTERNLVELLGALDPRDARQAVVTLRRAGSLAERLPDHIACEALLLSGRSRWGGLRLARAASSRGAHVLHARNTGCWWDAVVAKLCAPRLKLVFGYHGLDHGGAFRPRDRWAARLACRLGAEFTTVSRHGARRLADECGVPERRIHVIRNGVREKRLDRSSISHGQPRAALLEAKRQGSARAESQREVAFLSATRSDTTSITAPKECAAGANRNNRAAVRQSLGADAEDVVFLGVGSLSPVKRFDRLLRALAAMGIAERSDRGGAPSVAGDSLLLGDDSPPIEPRTSVRADVEGMSTPEPSRGLKPAARELEALHGLFLDASRQGKQPATQKMVGTKPARTAHLWIAGDGPCRSELEALAGALGVADRVRWLGVCDDVPSLLAASDVFVCSSDSEELSNALLEAMAAGLPVVTTDVGDHAEIVACDARAPGAACASRREDAGPVHSMEPVRNRAAGFSPRERSRGCGDCRADRGTRLAVEWEPPGDHAEVVGGGANAGGDSQTPAGLVVPVGDEAALSRAMGELAINADLRHRLGEAAARRAGDFTFDAMVRGYAALYRRLFGNTGRKASSIDDASHSGRAAWRTVWLPA